MTTAAIVTAFLTAVNIVIAIWNVLYAQKRSDRREVQKWRSDQMMKLTSRLLQLSTERQSALEQFISELEGQTRIQDRPTKSGENVWEMELLVEQIRLLSDYLADKAVAVYQAHKAREDAWANADSFDGDVLMEVETLAVDRKTLMKLHHSLVNAFRVLAQVER